MIHILCFALLDSRSRTSQAQIAISRYELLLAGYGLLLLLLLGRSVKATTILPSSWARLTSEFEILI
jgi:hypothetical protein